VREVYIYCLFMVSAGWGTRWEKGWWLELGDADTWNIL
jgi:hypothetical protein